MVDLKSFRRIEPDCGNGVFRSTETSQNISTTVNSSFQTDNNNKIENAAHQNNHQDADVSTTSNSFSRSSKSSLVGGNLTSNESSISSQNNRRQSEDGTLSSREEYQSAKHELNNDYDDDVDEQTSLADKNDLITDKADEVKGPSDIDELQIDNKTQMAGNGVKIIENKNATTNDDKMISIDIGPPSAQVLNKNLPETGLISAIQTPKTGRLSALEKVSSQSPILRQGAMSPASNKRLANIVAMTNGGDNASLNSSNQFRGNSMNSFEIRWQNLRLMARRSKLPRFIVDSLPYKFLYKQQDFQLADDSCYSPPIRHKIPPTINEDSELSSRTISAKISMQNNSSISVDDIVTKGRDQESEFKCILDNVSGSVYSGQITAILGPSGVGKTTLLNSLTGRNTLDGTGRVSLIGDGARKRMSVVTVPQADILPDKLTTYEDLQFTSRIKNPEPNFDHKKNIDNIVKHLQLDKFLHTRIDKLSGGEARRLSIGRELLNSPDIMILDEPTSGLDANTCKKIITVLRDIVEHSDNILDKPMSIIVTIHQPQQEVYNLFHRIYVMAIGGHAIYGGPPNLLLPTLLEQSSLGQVTSVVDQLNENPAIVALEVASGEYGPELIEELAMLHENRMYEEFFVSNDEIAAASPAPTPKVFKNARANPMNSPRVDLFHRKRLNSTDSSIGRPTPMTMRKNLSGTQLDRMSAITNVSYASTYDPYLPDQNSRLKVDKRLRRSVVMKSDIFHHTITLMKRVWLTETRDMFLVGIRIVGYLLVAAGIIQIFAHALDPNENICPHFESEVEDIPKFMSDMRYRLSRINAILRQTNDTHMLFFHLILCITMVTSALTGLVFPLQLRMFIREYKNGWYSPASFILSHTFAELPMDMIGPMLSIVIVYPLCDLPDSPYYWREIGFIVVTILTSIITKSQAQFIGAFLMDSVENSVFMSCVSVTLPALLSGIPVRVEKMTTPLWLASFLSFLRYSFESLLSLRFGYGMCPCDEDVVDGYPIDASTEAVPNQLKNLVSGFLSLNGINTTDSSSDTSSISSLNDIEPPSAEESLFLRFMRLMTEAGNLFPSRSEELGNCDSYRSLYMIDNNVPNNILPRWLLVMMLMFVVSRFLVYFAVKAVIKIRK